MIDMTINEGSSGQLYIIRDTGQEPADGSAAGAGSEAAGGVPAPAEPLSRSQRVMEAVLFAVPGAVELGMLAKACGIEKAEAAREAAGLKRYLEEGSRGVIIKQVGDRYELCSNPEYFEELVRVVSNPRKPELTDVMMETLAIVAGKSLVTKAEIEKIRGVKSDFAVGRLVEYGLIEEKGRLSAPGRPMLFGPTDEFYRRFGIDDDHPVPLPDSAGEAEMARQTDEEIRELEAGDTEES